MLEVLLVLTLIAILVGTSLVFSRVNLMRADLNAQTSDLVTRLQLIQSQAASGVGSGSHGVHLESNQYVLFEGASYDSNDPANFSIVFPSSVVIQNLSLNGGGSDIIFVAPQGETTNFGSFELYSSDSGQARTITITALGLVQY